MPNDRNDNQRRSSRPENVPEYTLESREYRDKNGQEHHHTNVWMSRHQPDADKADSD